jgi:hypothetical protein
MVMVEVEVVCVCVCCLLVVVTNVYETCAVLIKSDVYQAGGRKQKRVVRTAKTA